MGHETIATMTVEGVEHALELYNENNGHGLAYCGERVGPWDLGPNQGEVQCQKCKEKASLT